jgi:hypothetical protein
MRNEPVPKATKIWEKQGQFFILIIKPPHYSLPVEPFLSSLHPVKSAPFSPDQHRSSLMNLSGLCFFMLTRRWLQALLSSAQQGVAYSDYRCKLLGTFFHQLPVSCR